MLRIAWQVTKRATRAIPATVVAKAFSMAASNIGCLPSLRWLVTLGWRLVQKVLPLASDCLHLRGGSPGSVQVVVLLAHHRAGDQVRTENVFNWLSQLQIVLP